MNYSLAISSNSYSGSVEGVIERIFNIKNELFDSNEVFNQDNTDSLIIHDDARETIRTINENISFFWKEMEHEGSLDGSKEKINIQEVFPNCRALTKTEAKKYKESLATLYKPTGEKFFDL